jgi:hypothetical protein
MEMNDHLVQICKPGRDWVYLAVSSQPGRSFCLSPERAKAVRMDEITAMQRVLTILNDYPNWMVKAERVGE